MKVTKSIISILLTLLIFGSTLELLARVDSHLYQWLNGKPRPVAFDQIGYFDSDGFYHLYEGSKWNGHIMNNLGFIDNENYYRDKEPDEIRIIVIGNSVAAGDSDEGTSWPLVLRAWLREQHPNTPISILNASLPSSSEDAMIDHFEHTLLSYQPDIVIYNSRPRQDYLVANCRLLANRPLITNARTKSNFLEKYFTYRSNDWDKAMTYQRIRNLTLPQSDPPKAADFKKYNAVLDRLIALTRQNNIELILSTLALRDPSNSQNYQTGLSIALYYASCLTSDGFLSAIKSTNDLVREKTLHNQHVVLFDSQTVLAGQDKYFVPNDIIHHTIIGNDLLVKHLSPMVDNMVKSIIANHSNP